MCPVTDLTEIVRLIVTGVPGYSHIGFAAPKPFANLLTQCFRRYSALGTYVYVAAG